MSKDYKDLLVALDIGTAKVVGAALVLVALALTRSERQPAPRES